MSSKVTTIGLKGLEGYLVKVEVQAVPGIHSIVIVGLPDISVKESKQRIMASFHSLDYSFIQQKFIINLSPPEQKKNGPMFDLPIAIGILISMDEIKLDVPETSGFLGTLSLDGSIHPVEGMLPAVLAARGAGLHKLYLPFDESFPSIEVDELELIHVKHLGEVLDHLSGKQIAKYSALNVEEEEDNHNFLDFQQIIGHSHAKHALEVAAAGEHHLLMSGPPGCGKSLLAESFPSILPSLTKKARLEMMSVYHLSGMPNDHTMHPPFRNPHHSSSGVSLIGGGQIPKPGEVSLAHHGVLFLDEIAEFPKKTLEMLRQPLENGTVTISRARTTVKYPSAFILIGAMNPCPCGYQGANNRYCTCTPKQIAAYQNRLSGPIRDRFDIFLPLHPINIKASSKLHQESSKIVRERVAKARERQFLRYGEELTNSRAPFDILLQTSPLTEKQTNLIQNLAYQHGWSNRKQIKIIRLSRTIADLRQQKEITEQHIWEAIKLNGWSNAGKLTDKIVSTLTLEYK